MNLTSGKLTSLIVQVFVAVLLLVVLSGDTCKKSDTEAIVCGSPGSVSLDKTLTVSDPTFSLKTPQASSGESCPAHFTFVFSWANPSRGSSGDIWQSIPIDVFDAFSVLSSDGKVGGHFNGGSGQKSDEWEVDQISNNSPYEVVFSDHNAATSLSSLYSINTKLTSTRPEDSVKISASIGYYLP